MPWERDYIASVYQRGSQGTLATHESHRLFLRKDEKHHQFAVKPNTFFASSVPDESVLTASQSSVIRIEDRRLFMVFSIRPTREIFGQHIGVLESRLHIQMRASPFSTTSQMKW